MEPIENTLIIFTLTLIFTGNRSPADNGCAYQM